MAVLSKLWGGGLEKRNVDKKKQAPMYGAC